MTQVQHSSKSIIPGIGARIEALVEQMGFQTQRAMAQSPGISKSTLNRYIKTDRCPDPHILLRLTKRGVSVDALLWAIDRNQLSHGTGKGVLLHDTNTMRGREPQARESPPAQGPMRVAFPCPLCGLAGLEVTLEAELERGQALTIVTDLQGACRMSTRSATWRARRLMRPGR
jgi:hypothetical protein